MNCRNQAHRAEPSSETPFDDALRIIAYAAVLGLVFATVLGVLFVAAGPHR